MKHNSKRQISQGSADRKQARTVIIIASAILSLCGLCYYFADHATPMIDRTTTNSVAHAPTSPTNSPVATTEDELESYLIGKTTAADVMPGFTPVIIYRVDLTNGDASVAGNGTYFVGSNGPQVVTAAHVFSRENNGTTNHFLIRKLRPLEGHIVDLAITSFMDDRLNFPGYTNLGVDLVLCKVSINAKAISCFYDNEARKAEREMTTDMIPLREAKQIRSLVSGRTFPVVGMDKKKYNGLSYLTVMMDARPGESGTGFVDDEGFLYVLKGHSDTLIMSPGAADRMGYPRDATYSVVLGPLGIRK